MKLYATTTSERASKGQGGNEYLEIELFVNDQKRPIGHIFLDYNNDIKDGYDEDEWVLKWKQIDQVDPSIIAQGHTIPNRPKGKQKKDEPREGLCHCGYPCIYGTDYCERHQTP